ncbi:lipoprotein [Pimelobacter simplex]|uniref:lipoprotein n=1 Tax=Nocardioides simplex TaxID=2045 RepID=UPI003AAAC31A
MRSVMGAAAVLGVVGVLGLAGCSGSDAEGEDDRVEAFAPVGAADSPCPLPIVFDRDQGWVPQPPKADEATDPEVRDGLASLTSPGPFDLACELRSPVDFGYLRVFTGPAALADRDPEALLTTFVDVFEDGAGRDLTFTSATSDAGSALVEVAYEVYDEYDEAYLPRRAFLAPGDDGVALLLLGGLDAEEHEGMLPAYELARRSVRLAD